MFKLLVVVVDLLTAVPSSSMFTGTEPRIEVMRMSMVGTDWFWKSTLPVNSSAATVPSDLRTEVGPVKPKNDFDFTEWDTNKNKNQEVKNGKI